jgi:hypothetical protein
VPEAKEDAAETITVTLEGKYAGWRADCDADPDWGTLAALQSGNFDRIGTALLRCVRSWTFQGRDGQPAALTPDGLATVPGRALIQLANDYATAWAQLPNRSAGA